MAVEVLDPGPLTTVQDLGRPGWAHLGVPRSGAADRSSLRLANRLVANTEDQPALETTAIGPRLRFDSDAIVAVTGAEAPLRVAGRERFLNGPVHVRAGETLVVGPARRGLRNYIAIRGGIRAPETLGSAASDVLSGLGPAALTAGDCLEVGPTPSRLPNLGVASVLRSDPLRPSPAEPAQPAPSPRRRRGSIGGGKSAPPISLRGSHRNEIARFRGRIGRCCDEMARTGRRSWPV